ncbi:MAG TPA: FHA domain-containing protein [Geminicoccaceae bacterium]
MEAPERTLVVGRSPHADVTLAEPSVAPRHAEIVVTSRGRLHVTDCGSPGGTWIQDDASGAWRRVRQAFVRPEMRLRLGEHVCRAGDLVGALSRAPGDAVPAGSGGGVRNVGGRGRIERDPATGEIVRRRF